MHLNNKDSIISNHPPIAIIVLGASGDLAKRKTFPCLFQLYERNILLPSTSLSQQGVIIYGFGRTQLSHEEFRQSILPFLSCNHRSGHRVEYEENAHAETDVKKFLSMCFYQVGRGYDDAKAFCLMRNSIGKIIKQKDYCNWLFYMATPPNLFVTATKSIIQVFHQATTTGRRSDHSRGFLRVLYEKPFGSDLNSYKQLSDSLLNLLDEQQIFRIDHYLGKDMVRRIPFFRFGDSHPSLRMIMHKKPHFWSRHCISKVVISLKEEIGTDGRGGYFDQYGIIRDVVQNHLLQIMCLVAMEEQKPGKQDNEDAVRDAKCALLRHVHPPTLEDCVVGQYVGYRKEPMVKENSYTATFAVIRLFVDNDRWRGVPFILLAGKGLDEKSVEVDVIFREDTLSNRNEKKSLVKKQQQRQQQQKLTIGIQPQPYICFRTHATHEKHMAMGVKQHSVKQSKMIWNFEKSNDDSYSKLVYDAIQGRSSSFVRDDELRLSWTIFTPLLHRLEHVEPYPYEFGSKGPLQAHKILDLNDSKDFRRSKL